MNSADGVYWLEMIRFALFLGSLWFFASACSGGDSSNPGATVTVASTEAPSATPRPDFTTGTPIAAMARGASIAAERDGRHLMAVAGLGDEVLLDASKDVPYLPGEIIGQGAKAYDQEFLVWNPGTGSFRLAWSNQSVRHEAVLGLDGEWALSLLYRLNPGNNWILRLRNVSTGEVRDIDHESEQLRGLEMANQPQIESGRVVYTRYSAEGASRIAEIIVYTISEGAMRSLAKRERTSEGVGEVLANATTDGSRAAWTEQVGSNMPLKTVIFDLETGSSQSITDPRIGVCGIADADWFVCSGPATLLGTGENIPASTFAYRPADRKLITLSSSAGAYPNPWNGWVQVCPFSSSANSDCSIYNLKTFEAHRLGSTTAGATPLLVDGWFVWIDWVDDADARHNWSASTLRVVPLQ